MAVAADDSTTLLRHALVANAVFSCLTGFAALVAAPPLASWLGSGAGVWMVRLLGAGLLTFAGILTRVVRADRPDPRLALAASIADARSVAGSVALLGAFLLTGCGAADVGSSPVPTGAWTGDISFPSDLDAAWGATWHVARPDDADRLEISLEMPNTSGPVGPVPLEVEGDALRFPLAFRRAVECEASRREDGSWRGRCRGGQDVGTYGVVLVPPGREVPVGLPRLGLERIEGDWRTASDGPVVIHTRPGTEAHRHRNAVLQHARRATEHAVDLLGAHMWEGPLRLVYLESPAEMERAFGRPVRGGSADAGANGALLVTYEGGATGVVHEVLHVVSMRQWGAAAPPGMWLQEGLAEWGEGGHCGDVPHGLLDRYLHARGDGLPVPDLTAGFRQHSDVVTMPQVTTLVAYLVDAHGLEAVRGLWERGIGEVEAVLGYDGRALQERWRAWVEERYEPATEHEFRATIGSEDGCPREALQYDGDEPVETGSRRDYYERQVVRSSLETAKLFPATRVHGRDT